MSDGNGYESVLESDEEMFEALMPEGKWEEADEEGDDTEGIFDNVAQAIGSLPKYRSGPTRLPFRPQPFRPIGGITGANLQTPAGRAQMQFRKPLATQEAVNTLARQLKGEIAGVAASVRKVNQALDKNTAMLDKKVNVASVNFKKTQDQNQMMTLLPMLMTPKLQQITLTPTDPVGQNLTAKCTVNSAQYSGTMLPLLLVMMMGGMGTSGGDSNMMTTMLLVLALGGSLGN